MRWHWQRMSEMGVSADGRCDEAPGDVSGRRRS